MVNLLKIGLLLFLKLNIYYCLGILLERVRFLPKEKSFIAKMLYGFLAYHALFWCVAFPCMWLNLNLSLLSVLWLIVLCITLTGAFLTARKELLQEYHNFAAFLFKYKIFVIPCILLQVFVIYYVCVNGQVDVDARTYIGEATVALDTNRISGFIATSGWTTGAIGIRRLFSVFGINSAVICKIFKLHPLIYCRTVQAAINVLLMAASTFEIFYFLYRRDKNLIEKSILSTMLAQVGCFLFANSIYAGANFLLYRSYEGKAYCAGLLILITILISVQLCRCGDRRWFVMLFIDMLAGASISSSAIFILPVIAGSILLSYILIMRKWGYILFLILSLLPNITYILLKIGGFNGIRLKG